MQDLSNRSNEGGESTKKHRKENLNDSSFYDNMAEGLKPPECFNILFAEFKKRYTKSLSDRTQTTQKNQIKGTTQLTDL